MMTKKRLRQQLRQVRSVNTMDEKFVRVRYVRYADDFLISIIGPYSLAIEIKNLVTQFLLENLELHMDEAKISITNATKQKAFFLGTYIQWKQHIGKKVVMKKLGKATRITARIALTAPMDKLIQKLVVRQFVKWNPDGTKILAKALTRLVNFDHTDIIGYFNAIVRGILNYYPFADNRRNLGSIVRFLHMSCARTLALKYKMRFVAKAYKKFGSLLACPNTGVGLFKPKTLKRIRQFDLGKPMNLEVLERSWANKLTRRNLNRRSAICGGIPAQMHHVRKIAELKSRRHLDWFTM